LPDSGTCPAGTMLGPCNDPSGQPMQGCITYCTPPPPFCAPLPASCGANATCSCLPNDICMQAGSCGEVDYRGVSCLCA
jgi:hypothetical protein